MNRIIKDVLIIGGIVYWSNTAFASDSLEENGDALCGKYAFKYEKIIEILTPKELKALSPDGQFSKIPSPVEIYDAINTLKKNQEEKPSQEETSLEEQSEELWIVYPHIELPSSSSRVITTNDE